jgi:hypothetical protein
MALQAGTRLGIAIDVQAQPWMWLVIAIMIHIRGFA